MRKLAREMHLKSRYRSRSRSRWQSEMRKRVVPRAVDLGAPLRAVPHGREDRAQLLDDVRAEALRAGVDGPGGGVAVPALHGEEHGVEGVDHAAVALDGREVGSVFYGPGLSALGVDVVVVEVR